MVSGASSHPTSPIENRNFLPQVFALALDEAFLDCGAFDGDTLHVFLSRSKARFREYLAIEPDPESFAKLDSVVAALPADVRARVQTHNCGVGRNQSVVSFEGGGGLGSKALAGGSISVRLIPIDDLRQESRRLTFIKMDIEGAEEDALRGGREVIEHDEPILAICVYHNQQDVWTLPLLMKEMLPHHHMFLRCHEGDGWQTVAYAVPPARVMSDGLS